MLDVFVACPNDIVEEREAIRRVVNEINKTLGRQQEVHLDVYDWEEDAYPGFGADPQDVINQQMGEACDIFIGMLWTRYGTPTPRAGSGIEEEFGRALARYKDDPGRVRLMLYFSERPVNPRTVDTEQMRQVSAFRDRIPELGGLYKTYADTVEFENAVRMHLTQQIQEWGKSWGVSAPTPAPEGPTGETEASIPTSGENVEVVDEAQQAEEEGLLDLMEKAVEQGQISIRSVEHMKEAIEVLGIRMQERTEQLQSHQLGSDMTSIRIARRIADGAADDMMQLVKAIDEETPVFGDSYSELLNAYGQAGLLLSRTSQPDAASIENALASVNQLKRNLEESRGPLRKFRRIVDDIPPMSSNLNRAKRRLGLALDKLDVEWEKAIDFSVNAERMLAEIMPPPEKKRAPRRKKGNKT
jgi:hypothetical protein